MLLHGFLSVRDALLRVRNMFLMLKIAIGREGGLLRTLKIIF